MAFGFKDKLRLRYRAWRYRRRKDPGEISAIMRLVEPGSIAIDVGGHKGAYTYWLRRAAGENGRVITFEPQPSLAERLRAMVKGLGWSNVNIEWLALSSSEGELTLHVPKGGPSPGASLEARVGQPTDAVTVPVTTLDAYVSKHSLSPIGFIKVDVEGHELELFRGAEATLRRDRPVLLFECEERHRAGTTSEVFEFLTGLGYSGQFFYGRDLRPLSDFNPARHHIYGREPYVNNFLFTAK